MATSALIIEEHLANGDERFLAALRDFHDVKRLAAITDKWKRDHRPWARQQIFKYVDMPMNVLNHETDIKRLFKHAEAQDDVELVAAFAVAFDRLVRRFRKTRHRYDWRARTSWTVEELKTPRNTMRKPRTGRNPMTGREIKIPGRFRPNDFLFSYHTRYYLRRRAWRFFRRAGHRKPTEYASRVAQMLRRYGDDDVRTGENLIDCWSLMHACFRQSDVLEIDASKVNVKAGRSLGEMVASPDFPELWREKPAARVLVSLLTSAQARPVRVWSMQMLRRDHVDNFSDFTADEILPLLDHDDEEVQQFAAEMLERSSNLAKIDLDTWLKLLRTRNLVALETIARLMEQHVTPDRLSLEQLVELTTAAPVPVARLGLRFLQSRRIESAAERGALVRLSSARSEAVAGDITTWALSILGAADRYDVENVSRFFDSLLQPARDAAWAWLTPTSAGYNDPGLWSRLIETPYDDLRFHVVAELQRRTKLPGTQIGQITHVWTTVLLNIHRGGRTKLVALKQISRAIVDDPQNAEPLLPVLAVAIRSVRMPEVRTGLSAVVTAVELHPPLADAVARHLPEMRLSAEAAVSTSPPPTRATRRSLTDREHKPSRSFPTSRATPSPSTRRFSSRCVSARR
jgi:hypothetical protein